MQKSINEIVENYCMILEFFNRLFRQKNDEKWEIAKRVCCAEELELLERSTDKDREFTRMWAMKESYIKKSGKDVGNSLARVNTLTKVFVQIINKENSVISICK